MSDLTLRRLSRRDMLKLIGLGTAGLALAACGKPTGEPAKQTPEKGASDEVPTTYEQGEITVLLCCATLEMLDLQAEYNKEFEGMYPGVTVNQQQTPAGQNYFEKLQTLIAAGTPPDIFDMWEGYVGPYAELGALQNLTPFVEADPDLSFDKFQPAAVEAASWKGGLYALMRDFYPGPSTLFYNPALFDEAGVTYPNSDWTWNDMRDAASKLMKVTNGVPEQWGLAFDIWFVPYLYWIWSNGGDVFNEDETKCTLTDAKSVEALQYWADLINKDKCAVSTTEMQTLGGSMTGFNTGKVGMYLGYAWNIQDMLAAKAEGLDWKACLSPKAPGGGRVYYMHLECWANAAATKLPQTSWRYIRDYQFKAVDRFVQLYPGIPLLKDKIDLFLTPENASYGWDRIPEIVADPKNIRVPGAGAKWDKISGLIQSELDLLFINEKSAADAAATACPLIDGELARGD